MEHFFDFPVLAVPSDLLMLHLEKHSFVNDEGRPITNCSFHHLSVFNTICQSPDSLTAQLNIRKRQ